MVGENGVPTFLFTDIEGSTLLWEKYPGEMVEALSRHNRLLESHFEQHRGTVFKTVGDEYCVVFKDPDDAVSAAESVQRALGGSDWPEHCPLRVRIAVHTGPATAIGSDFFGPTLNRVSRLMDTAHGGQCVVTAATASLLPPSRRSQLVDLGPHRLKDLLEPLHLYQVASSESFPPLRTLNAARTNLPYQPTTFVGRAKELVDVRSKLHRSRLVTLTGLGGSGKTRLALQAAAEEVEKQPEGVWLVELSSVQDPAAVPMAVASVVERSSETGTGAIVDALVDRRMLLVVDGCEHLIDEVASLVSEILARCPSVKVLGTSRQALGLPGEQVVRLASLPVPSAEEPFDSDTVARYDSVQLFDDRARMARPEFAITEHNAESVARLCRRLEGIPLAIELAAARVRAMPVDQVEARVADRFGFLKSQGRGRLPRQQTLRALIDWSYDLLADAERTLLRRLSVFSGGWTLRAAEQVCGTSGMIDEEEILDLLASLVDKSLIIFEEIEGRGRYRILDTVRQYAAARLAETEDLSPFRHRHADLYLQFLEERLAELHSRSRGEAIRLLREDLDNIVSALDWCERNEELSVRLIEVMHYAWPFFHASTSNRWRLGLLTRLLDLWADKLPEKCVTTGTYLRCLHLALAGEMDEAKEVLRRLWDSSEEPPYTLGRLNAMGYVHWLVGDVEGALRIFRHAEEEAGDNLELLGYSTQNQGSIALCQGRYLDARAYYERALEAHRRNGDTRAMIAVMSSLAKLAWLMDEREQALDWFVRYSRLERSWGYPAVQARQARDVARSIAECDPRHGAMLWGGARTMEEEEGPLADPTDGVGNEAFEAALRTRLGESDYADAVAEGARSLAWVRVRIHQALESLEHSRTQTPPADAPQTTGTA